MLKPEQVIVVKSTVTKKAFRRLKNNYEN
jgi:hypothetical protein